MATWKKVLREDLAVGTGLITHSAGGSSTEVTLTLSDNADTPNTDVITITLGDNLTASSINANGFELDVTGLADIATSGSYSDLSGTPTIPSAIFSTIAVNGQTSVAADTATDTLTFAGGGDLVITTDSQNDTVTFTVDLPVSGTDFDPVGTDNSTDVTLDTTNYQYLSISGQEITLLQIDATTDISGLGDVALSNDYGDLDNVPTIPSELTIEDDANDNSYYLTLTDNLNVGDTFNPIASLDGALKWVVDGSGNGTLEIGGDFVVSGTTTTLQTQNVIVEDKLITLANPDSGGDGTVTSANAGGIEIKSGDPAAVDYPSILWSSTANLSGWTIQNHAATNGTAVPKEISTMQFASATAPTTEQKGDFYYDTANDFLYVCLGA